MQPPDEQAAITRVLSGRLDAFRVLVDLHGNSVYRVCLLVLGDAGRAEDLAQETFCTAHRQLARYDAATGTLRTWLLTIARRLCSNSQRRRTERPMADLPEIVAPERSSPVAAASRSEVWSALDAALARLPAEFRTAFVLAEIEELPLREIAGIEGVAEGTVKSRVHRARLALRASMSGVFHDLTTPLP